MTKRALKRLSRETAFEDFEDDGKIRRLPVGRGWSPLMGEEDRDQAYLKTLKPRSAGQAALLAAMDARSLVLALGPAGTGKTYLAIAKAVAALEAGKVARIVLSRPAVEAGESIGFLPGELEDKLAPYLRPLYDALSDRMSMKRVRSLITEGAIEIAPVGFMRGRTLNNAFVVIDEAQNCTYGQLKMLLTRLGWSSTMVVTGDPGQSDLLPELSGLERAAARLEGLASVAVIRLNDADIVRHALVAEMLAVLPTAPTKRRLGSTDGRNPAHGAMPTAHRPRRRGLPRWLLHRAHRERRPPHANPPGPARRPAKLCGAQSGLPERRRRCAQGRFAGRTGRRLAPPPTGRCRTATSKDEAAFGQGARR